MSFFPLSPTAVRSIRIYEPMVNVNIERSIGTGDWLIMLFHHLARLNKDLKNPSVLAKMLIIWPLGEKQFFSLAIEGGSELHSWLHVEGT